MNAIPRSRTTARHWRSITKTVIFGDADAVVALYVDVIRNCKRKGWNRTGRVLTRRLSRGHGVFIGYGARIGSGLTLRHPVGIVIGEGVTIGQDITIYQNVTIGGARIGDFSAGNYPAIGDGTVIFAGAAILGAIRIGRNCTIGANAVVISDVPDGATAIGVPARILLPDDGAAGVAL
ncbi:serine O-acetyltransferase [Qingshengfaniella alkalisoli]|uniref:Serine acetyltransferase n=1 Tax=Qingshengfaniella alkalisoli TaxID=2599296 RepID=A0A5B8J8X5_9RHOB|nr:hypothetical protein [Qingshengfaniella alkalisoli]QDY70807.1 hypothetical protein FPZ52_13935 [Qingshengfaniella alkalisoli]